MKSIKFKIMRILKCIILIISFVIFSCKNSKNNNEVEIIPKPIVENENTPNIFVVKTIIFSKDS